MKKSNVNMIAQGAIIAALYVVLTYIANLLGLASGVIQVRFSEALTILPYFTFAAVPGLTIGCLLANILTGGVIWDVIFGTVATLLGAACTYMLRNKKEFLAPVPPIVSNTVIVPFVLKLAYGVPDSYPFLFFTVFAGELISCGILGLILLYAVKPKRDVIFRTGENF